MDKLSYLLRWKKVGPVFTTVYIKHIYYYSALPM